MELLVDHGNKMSGSCGHGSMRQKAKWKDDRIDTAGRRDDGGGCGREEGWQRQGVVVVVMLVAAAGRKGAAALGGVGTTGVGVGVAAKGGD